MDTVHFCRPSLDCSSFRLYILEPDSNTHWVYLNQHEAKELMDCIANHLVKLKTESDELDN